jgi:homoserine O-succinyltransferase
VVAFVCIGSPVPLVAHSPLPTFDGLRASGDPMLTVADARAQDIRELHIGLLNMMPDAALTVTEQQFMRLVGSANPIVHLWVHPFTVPGLARSPDTQAYIDAFYTPFDELREAGLDALIVSGANVTNPRLQDEPFWRPLLEVVEWAVDNVTSVLCSCLATHALVQRFYGVHRRRLLNKRWGVYGHRTVAPDHPLLRAPTRASTCRTRAGTLSPPRSWRGRACACSSRASRGTSIWEPVPTASG